MIKKPDYNLFILECFKIQSMELKFFKSPSTIHTNHIPTFVYNLYNSVYSSILKWISGSEDKNIDSAVAFLTP